MSGGTIVLASSRPVAVAADARSAKTSSTKAAPAAIKSARPALARRSTAVPAGGDVDVSVNRHVACGQKIDRSIERVAVEGQIAARDGDGGIVEDAVGWKVERGVAADVQRAEMAVAAGVEVGAIGTQVKRVGKC